jgi:hypothetical protein
LLYEIHDPARYLTPDVVADFSQVAFEEVGPDRIAVQGGSGAARPERLKVTIGCWEGFIGEGAISYAGPGAVGRARLAGEIVRERLAQLGLDPTEVRVDLIGVDAIGPAASDPREGEARLRVSAHVASTEAAARVGQEVEALYTNGPAGGGGARTSVRPVLGVTSAFISRAAVRPRVHIEVAP